MTTLSAVLVTVSLLLWMGRVSTFHRKRSLGSVKSPAQATQQLRCQTETHLCSLCASGDHALGHDGACHSDHPFLVSPAASRVASEKTLPCVQVSGLLPSTSDFLLTPRPLPGVHEALASGAGPELMDSWWPHCPGLPSAQGTGHSPAHTGKPGNPSDLTLKLEFHL